MKQVTTILLACALLIVMVGGSGAQDMETGTVSSAFSATGFAEAAGLGGVTGAGNLRQRQRQHLHQPHSQWR